MSRRRASGERGAGSILVLGAVAVVLTALLVVLTLAAGYDARHRAAAAADWPHSLVPARSASVRSRPAHSPGRWRRPTAESSGPARWRVSRWS